MLSTEIDCELNSLPLSTPVFLDGTPIRWKRDKTLSETLKGIQKGPSPATSPTILIRLRQKILWSGWPAPNEKGELISNMYTIIYCQTVTRFDQSYFVTSVKERLNIPVQALVLVFQIGCMLLFCLNFLIFTCRCHDELLVQPRLPVLNA